jgi:hypothetical protein
MRGWSKIIKWVLVSLITVFFLFSVLLFVSNIFLVRSGYISSNNSQNSESHDYSADGFNNSVELETLMQSRIDPGFEKSIGVMPGTNWYAVKIFTEKTQNILYLSNKAYNRAVFCKRRLEEFIILSRNGDYENADKALTLYIAELKKFDKASLINLPMDDKAKVELGKSFAIIEIMSKNQNNLSREKFIEAKMLSETLWK